MLSPLPHHCRINVFPFSDGFVCRTVYRICRPINMIVPQTDNQADHYNAVSIAANPDRTPGALATATGKSFTLRP
ncbi:hypothetical protein LR61_14620 [Morganella morganii]|nr:hypothetical protein LR61_14620 [Morganella morganii]